VNLRLRIQPRSANRGARGGHQQIRFTQPDVCGQLAALVGQISLGNNLMSPEVLPLSWRSIFDRVLQPLRSGFGFVRAHFWPILCALLVCAFTYFVIDPFGKKPDPQAQDVAAAWTGSIEKLGILAIFPPEEDFHVGDIWAVVADTDSSTPLLGRAVRLDHLDLRAEILDDIRNRTAMFAETTDIKPGEKFRKQDANETGAAAIADPKISLTLAAFPGITISHSVRAASALSAGLAGFGAARQDQETEVIRIPVAETYGVTAAAAYGRLASWCTEPNTKFRCTDAYARNLLAFAVDAGVQTKREGAYTNSIQLRLINRVFLTREIQHQRRQTSGRGASGNTSGQTRDVASAGAPDGSNVAAQANSAADAAARNANVPAGPQGASGSLSRGDDVEIEIQETFQRPVAFGYRAITLVLTPPMPPAKP